MDAADPFALNAPLVEDILVRFIRSEVQRVGFRRGVFGLSGGIDSTLSAYLAAKALGPENVCGIRMPYSTSSEETMDHGSLVARELGIRMMTVPIAEPIDAYFRQFPDASRLRRANKMARERMTVLYDQSAAQDALVIGTSNKTELLIGYGTIHGDMASALNPIGDLYKTQVRTLSSSMGVPEAIIRKNPTADLWVGQTDEAELGFTYAEVDRLLMRMVDERARVDDLIADGFDPAFVTKIAKMVQASHYKRRLPLIAKLSYRTIGRDFLYARDWGT
jgi:NAD+ synthase